MTGEQALRRLMQIVTNAKKANNTDNIAELEKCQRELECLQKQLEAECAEDQYRMYELYRKVSDGNSNTNYAMDALGWASGMTPMKKLFDIFT